MFDQPRGGFYTEHMENFFRSFLDALPPDPGIIGLGERSASVVLAPVVVLRGEPCFLFEKRASGIRQGDEICFPGGRPDPEDRGDPAATARRETAEELGIDPEFIRVDRRVGSLFGALEFIVDLYIGRILVDSLEELSPQPGEVSRVFAVPLGWFRENPPAEYELQREFSPFLGEGQGRIETFPARKLGLPRRYWQAWRGKPHKILAYSVEGEVIWGLTARMVHYLLSFGEGRG